MEAIEIIRKSIAIHEDWAAYFEKHPEMEKLEKHKKLGDAAWHRARIKDYNQAIADIQQLQDEDKQIKAELLYIQQKTVTLFEAKDRAKRVLEFCG